MVVWLLEAQQGSSSVGKQTREVQQLRRMKIIALALLVSTLSGFILSHHMGGQGIWAWVRAFCEAATVGALADWFAVVALFKHPLGIPFPHTAIIPRKKDNLGQSLATFVRDHFLDPQQLLDRLKVLDPALRIGQWLSQPEQAQRLGRWTRQSLLPAVDLLDEKAVKSALLEALHSRLANWDMAGTAHEVLGLLTRDGRHQVLLDESLRQLGVYLDSTDVKHRIAKMMTRHAEREWPKLLKMVDVVSSVEDISQRLSERLATALVAELQEVLQEPEHPLRKDYELWVGQYIERLGSDPELIHQIEQIKQQILEHPQVQAYLDSVWRDIMQLLKDDLSSEQSTISSHLETLFQGLGQRLQADDALRDALNQHLLESAASMAGSLRTGVTEHITRTVRNWDEKHLVRELELSVGSDLQYIRFSGTLVGGAIGLLLHALVVWWAAVSG